MGIKREGYKMLEEKRGRKKVKIDLYVSKDELGFHLIDPETQEPKTFKRLNEVKETYSNFNIVRETSEYLDPRDPKNHENVSEAFKLEQQQINEKYTFNTVMIGNIKYIKTVVDGVIRYEVA